MWRTMDGGAHVERRARRARRRRLPAHLDQSRTTRTSSSPSPIRARWSRRIAARAGATGTPSPPRRCITSRPTTRFPIASAAASRTRARACVQSRSDDGEITFHDWHPVNIQEYGMAAPDPKNPDIVYGSAAHERVALRSAHGQTTHVGPDTSGTLPGGGAMNRNVRTMPLALVAGRQPTRCSTRRTSCGRRSTTATAWTRISPDLDAADVGRAGQRRQVREHREAGADGQHHRARRRRRATLEHPLGRHRRRQHPGDDGRRRDVDERHAAADQAVDAHLQHRGGTLRPLDRLRRREHAAPRRHRIRTSGARTTAARRGRRSTPASPPAPSPTRFARIRGRRDCSTPATDTQVWVSFDDGDHWQSLRHNMPAISVRDLQVKDDARACAPISIAGTHGRGFWILDNVTPLRQAAARAGGAREERAVSVQAGDRRCACASASTIRRRGRRSCRRARIRRPARSSTTTCAKDAIGAGEARDSRRGRQGRADLLEHRTGVRSGSGQGHGRVRRGLQEDADGGRTAACRSTGRRRSSSSRRKAGMHRFSWDLQVRSRRRRRIWCRPATRRRRARCRAARIRTTTCRGCRRAPTPCGSRSTARRRRSRSPSGSIRACGSHPTALAQLNTLSTGLYWEAVAAHRAFNEAQALAATLDARSGAAVDAIKGELEALAPTGLQRNVRLLRRRGGGAGDAVAGSGEQRPAGRGDGDAGGRGGADGRADGGRRRSARAGTARHGAMGGGEGKGGRVAAVGTRARVMGDVGAE